MDRWWAQTVHARYCWLCINVFGPGGAPHDGVGLCMQETLTKLPRSTSDLLVVYSGSVLVKCSFLFPIPLPWKFIYLNEICSSIVVMASSYQMELTFPSLHFFKGLVRPMMKMKNLVQLEKKYMKQTRDSRVWLSIDWVFVAILILGGTINNRKWWNLNADNRRNAIV